MKMVFPSRAVLSNWKASTGLVRAGGSDAFLARRLTSELRRGKDSLPLFDFILQVDGRMHSCRVKDLDAAAEKACGFCDDFTSRFTDVSVGSVGSKEGYSTVIVRSVVGEKLVQRLDAEKEAVNKSEVTRLANLKQERAKKNFNDSKASG